MSSLDFAKELFSKYRQAAPSCSALVLTDSPTSPFSSSSIAPDVSSSCTLSDYQLLASSRGNGGLPSPPSLSTSSPSSFPSPSSSSCTSASTLSLVAPNRSSRSIHPTDPAEVLRRGTCGTTGAALLWSSLDGCAPEQPSCRPQLCSLTTRLPEPACRRQSGAEQPRQRHLLDERQIYPWMRSSGEERARERGGGGGVGGWGVVLG